jgi:ABC-type lipoprotein export system ATPase subunit
MILFVLFVRASFADRQKHRYTEYMHSLKIRNVYKSYTQAAGETQVLCGVTYQFHTNVSYAISGVSGTGKSTLLHILAGIDNPTTGSVLYDDKDLEQMAPVERAHFLQKTVGLVFQEAHLIKELTVIENVMLKALVAGMADRQAYQKAQQLLMTVGLVEKADHHPLSLSGGQQQRVAVLRAIFNQPYFLLADEPTGSLDAENAAIVLELLLQALHDGMGLIICSHDPAIAARMHHQLVLKQGILVESR